MILTSCPTIVPACYSKNYIRLIFSTLFKQLTKAASYNTCTLLPYVQNQSIFQYKQQQGGEGESKYMIDSPLCYLFSLYFISQLVFSLSSSQKTETCDSIATKVFTVKRSTCHSTERWVSVSEQVSSPGTKTPDKNPPRKITHAVMYN